MIKVFDIPPLLEAISEEIAAGKDPDPAKVNLLATEGPDAIESWLDAIEIVKGEAEIIKNRIEELKERRDARIHTAERMSNLLADILDNHFEGKIKTPTVTTWTQVTKSYDFECDDLPDQYVIHPEPRVDKKKMAEDYRAGKLPKGISVVENSSRSIRVRR